MYWLAACQGIRMRFGRCARREASSRMFEAHAAATLRNALGRHRRRPRCHQQRPTNRGLGHRLKRPVAECTATLSLARPCRCRGNVGAKIGLNGLSSFHVSDAKRAQKLSIRKSSLRVPRNGRGPMIDRGAPVHNLHLLPSLLPFSFILCSSNLFSHIRMYVYK